MHPYKNLPDSCFWLKTIGREDINFCPPFTIQATDKIMIAGSCFAQRIGEKVKNVLFTEEIHPSLTKHPLLSFNLPEDEIKYLKQQYQYGKYTARYDNIYTSRQLLQLFQRAYNIITLDDGVWIREDNRFVDAFRPNVVPEGYSSKQEVLCARDYHLSCVRKAFESLDILIFTVGLTEAWVSKKDNSVYPICPGTKAGGIFNAEDVAFKNFTTNEVIEDIYSFVTLLRNINQESKIILTVSPTPIIATATRKHVLEENTLMKSKLRVACAEICSRHTNIAYFPSYDLFMSGVYTRGRSFLEDMRTPSEDMIAKVMANFSRHFYQNEPIEIPSNPLPITYDEDEYNHICDDIIQTDSFR